MRGKAREWRNTKSRSTSFQAAHANMEDLDLLRSEFGELDRGGQERDFLITAITKNPPDFEINPDNRSEVVAFRFPNEPDDFAARDAITQALRTLGIKHKLSGKHKGVSMEMPVFERMCTWLKIEPKDGLDLMIVDTLAAAIERKPSEFKMENGNTGYVVAVTKGGEVGQASRELFARALEILDVKHDLSTGSLRIEFTDFVKMCDMLKVKAAPIVGKDKVKFTAMVKRMESEPQKGL